jgi:hypothetical protein
MQLNSKVAIIGKPGCFAAGTKVLKYDGSAKNIEDIMPFETLMGDDGTMRTVLELRQGTERMYRITPSSGLKGDDNSVVVNETHILVLQNMLTNEIVELTVADYLKLDRKKTENLHWMWNSVDQFHRFVIPIDETRAWRLGREVVTGKLASVPEIIRYGSIRIRQNFLRGILAFNPEYMSSKPMGIIDCGPNMSVCDDVMFVARSLGYRCVAFGRGSFCIRFHDRKRVHTAPFVCEYVGEGIYYGFVLDGNHRFLLEDFSVVRNTGKSTLMKDLLFQHKDHFPIGVVLSETNKESGDFDGLVPPLFMHDTYNQKAMDNLVLRQKQMVRKNGEGNPKNRAFVVVDDCMDDTSWVNHVTTKGIFKNGRHWDLFFVLSMQYCLGIPPSLRTCLDYIFLLREPNLRNRKQLWLNYASIFPYFEMFCDALDDLTQNYHCMVIKNRVLSNKIEDVVYWYLAKQHPKFRVGKDSWWRWAESHYNERYEEDEERQALQAQQNGVVPGVQDLGRKRPKGGVKLRVRMEN